MKQHVVQFTALLFDYLNHLPKFSEITTPSGTGRWKTVRLQVPDKRPQPLGLPPDQPDIKERTMSFQFCDSWLPLRGRWVEIRQCGSVVDAGTVDAVTCNDDVLWLGPDGRNKHRRIVERGPDHEVWADGT